VKFSGSSLASGAAAHGSADRPAEAPSAVVEPSVLGPTVVLKGELSCGESLVIQGQVHGSVTGTASVLIEKTAHVNGVLSAELIQVQEGAPLGNVELTGCIRRISGKK
jgi:cytoskeletal protein CcmA (bactofilin family)